MLAILGLGGNIHPRRSYQAQATEAIAHRIGAVLMRSSLYESEPWGFEADTPFINQALQVDTSLAPRELLECVHLIEHSLGRRRYGAGYASRTIDVDILTLGDITCNLEGLVIPHPRIAQRRFVLEPLAEMLPDGHHPTLGQTWSELLLACADRGYVRRLGR